MLLFRVRVLAGLIAPARSNSKKDPDRLFQRCYAVYMQHACSIHAVCMQSACNTVHAICMQNVCSMFAVRMQYECSTYAVCIKTNTVEPLLYGHHRDHEDCP